MRRDNDYTKRRIDKRRMGTKRLRVKIRDKKIRGGKKLSLCLRNERGIEEIMRCGDRNMN